MIKKILKKFIPKNILLFYHKVLALLASFLYGNPSKKLIVIGVTGTAGKSTTVFFISKILEEAGFKVGSTSSINFKIGQQEIENKSKMTMPGRFFMQKILKQMVDENCQYAIIETSSEGILQSRHLGIDYDILVFTNLSPEHIEAHHGFENYKKTKGKLFSKLKAQSASRRTKLKIIGGQKIKKTIIVNLDDEYADYFLNFEADEYVGYTTMNNELRIKNKELKILKAENLNLNSSNSSFTIRNSSFKLNLSGKFNVYNALAAISVDLNKGVSLIVITKALEKIRSIPGRMEIVIEKPFKVIVDYAHTPIELSHVYETIQNSNSNPPAGGQNFKLVCVLGSAGGGRDKWKRPVIGKLAAEYCDFIILTNEDPYDENPATIINEIEAGFLQITNDKLQMINYEKILERREAIKKALMMAKENDTVIITGKGCESWMCVANGQKVPWDDRKIVLEEFKKIKINK